MGDFTPDPVTIACADGGGMIVAMRDVYDEA